MKKSETHFATFGHPSVTPTPEQFDMHRRSVAVFANAIMNSNPRHKGTKGRVVVRFELFPKDATEPVWSFSHGVTTP